MKHAFTQHPSPRPRRTAANTHAVIATPEQQKAVQNRINTIAHKMLDAAEKIVDSVAVPVDDRPTVTVLRRQVANTLALWHFCANNRCRRARCCRGEPLDCLRAGLPLVMPDKLVGLLKMRRPRRPTKPRTATSAR